MKHIALVGSNVSKLPGGVETGSWSEEMSAPYYVFKDAGYIVDFFSVQGGAIVVDKKSLAEGTKKPVDDRFLADSEAMEKQRNSFPLSELKVDDYHLVFFAGGHGPLVDYLTDDVKNTVDNFWTKGKVIAAVCHGSLCFWNSSFLKGKRVTSFSKEEDDAVGIPCPVIVESKLREGGAAYERGPMWESFVVTDGQLVTGQNPASSEQCAKEALAAAQSEIKMPYRMMGNTGLAISVLSYGFWASFGSKADIKDQSGIDMAKECLRIARKGGINFFDNAETYGDPQGSAETIMGEAIRQLRLEDPILWRRTDIMITTKLFWGGKGVNEKGLSIKHLREGIDASLKRLQVDYVDLVFCHRPDPYTPTETVVRGMTNLVRSEKATAWGTSEWSAQQITEACWIAKMYGLEPPQFEQPQYHMFERERFEKEYFPMYQPPYNMGTTIWSPLASGLLTGKYNKEVPENSRAASKNYKWLKKRIQKWRDEGKIDKVITLEKYANEKFNCSVAQLALAWCIKNPNVTTILLGATKPHQLEENLGSLRVALVMTDEHLKDIDSILKNKPDAYSGYGNSSQWRKINLI